MARRYLDVNVFVYWLTGDPVYGPRALEWIRRAEAGPGEYVTASITVYELLVVLARLTGRKLRDHGLASTVMEALEGLAGLRIVETTWGDFQRATELMERHGLDMEDALHLAVALRSGCTEIVSNDRDFDRAPIRRVF